MSETGRKSNFELLRILAMLAIVTGHLFSEGRITARVPQQALLPSLFLARGARLATGLFALLGCWFLVDAPSFQPRRWLRLHATVLSYAVPLTLATALAWGGVGAGDFIRACLPVLGRPLWYASAWLILLAAAPALHAAAFAASRRDLGRAALALLVILTVPATFAGTIANDFFAAILWFVFLYLFVAWIKRGEGEPFAKIPRMCALAAGLGFYAAPVLVEWAIARSSGPCASPPAACRVAGWLLADFKTLPVFASALGLFVFFAKTDLGRIGWINWLARPAFAVYVAHQTPVFWPHLWTDIVRCREWAGWPSAPLVAVGCSVAIYLAVAFVEAARLALIRAYPQKSAGSPTQDRGARRSPPTFGGALGDRPLLGGAGGTPARNRAKYGAPPPCPQS